MTPEPIKRRLVALAEVLLCSSVPTQLGIGFALQVAGWQPTEPGGQLSSSYVLTLSIADTALLIALMVGLMLIQGENPALLWTGRRPIRREVIIGVMLIPICFAAVVVLLNLLQLIAPSLHNVEQNPLEHLAQTPRQAAVFGLVAILAGGVREELQRAFLLDRFERYLGGATVGLLVISVAFGLGHIVQGWDAVITTGVLGAFWALVYLRRRSSVAPVLSHAGFDALEILRAAIFP
jgi:membrane protease YdiL (CAAX protease family)